MYRPQEGAQGNSRNVRGDEEMRRGLVRMTMAQEAEGLTLHHKTTATLLLWPYYFLLKGVFTDVLHRRSTSFLLGRKKKKRRRGIHDFFFPPPVVLTDFNCINIDVRTPNVRVMSALMTLVTQGNLFAHFY